MHYWMQDWDTYGASSIADILILRGPAILIYQIAVVCR